MAKTAKKRAASKTKKAKKAVTKTAKKPAAAQPTNAVLLERLEGLSIRHDDPIDTKPEVYAQLKICLSRITHFPVSEISENDSLADKYKFDLGGKRVLAGNIEACFAGAGYPIPKKLDRNAMQGADTVGDVAELINEAFGL
ncbi:hypothetical protein LPW26_04435 [Rhodopseudomonas sp. HC1]|uniref:hypothetical protein n=1 Tax=Rhodopseudomonas infernalis TaxID=2897386 RepID=UPI001EE92F63|nr:hypothetical protein [Rhodopseudomonas infernalis]MCG6203875.1 hypothetical protein [Rhodopseudomonas infernalis]